MNKTTIHNLALVRANNYKRAESELLESIEHVDKERVYLEHGHTSTFGYVVNILKLSESVASNFMAVTRKSAQVPELRQAIQSGELTVSKARKITSVLDSQNQAHWIGLAKSLPQAKLEKEVAKSFPQFAIAEKIKPVCENRMLMQVGISEELHNMIKRVQDLESQRTKTPVNIEQALKSSLIEYLDRHDPIEKAKRSEQRQQHVLRQKRARQGEPNRYLSAQIKHAITLRDQARCTHTNQDGIRCENRRWLETHHIKQISFGGTNELTNLTTLCSVHHKDKHKDYQYKNH